MLNREQGSPPLHKVSKLLEGGTSLTNLSVALVYCHAI